MKKISLVPLRPVINLSAAADMHCNVNNFTGGGRR